MINHVSLRGNFLEYWSKYAKLSDIVKHLSGYEALEAQHSTLRNYFAAVQTENVAVKTENQELKEKRLQLEADLDESKQSKIFILILYNQF